MRAFFPSSSRTRMIGGVGSGSFVCGTLERRKACVTSFFISLRLPFLKLSHSERNHTNLTTKSTGNVRVVCVFCFVLFSLTLRYIEKEQRRTHQPSSFLSFSLPGVLLSSFVSISFLSFVLSSFFPSWLSFCPSSFLSFCPSWCLAFLLSSLPSLLLSFFPASVSLLLSFVCVQPKTRKMYRKTRKIDKKNTVPNLKHGSRSSHVVVICTTGGLWPAVHRPSHGEGHEARGVDMMF